MILPRKKRLRLPIAAYFVLAQVTVVIASVLKVKAVTLVLGAQGIALYGMLANLTQIGSHISAFGMHSSGVRSVAQVRGDSRALRETVAIYVLATAVFTTLAAFAVPLLAYWGGLFDRLGAPPSFVAPALGVAILCAAAATAQGTVFKGVGATRIVLLRNIVMPLAGFLLGLLSLFYLGLLGVTGFFIFQPLAGAIISVAMWQRVLGEGMSLSSWPSAAQLRAIVKPMLIGGGVFLVSSLVVEATILFGRWSLQHRNAIEELAFLNASWVLVTMSFGFMQGVMSTWLYPLLTHAVQRGEQTVSRDVDNVIFLTSTLGAVFVMVISPFTPLILRLVYSDVFVDATEDFNLALIGLMAQLVAAPILYLMLSRGQDRIYLLYHLLVGSIFASGIWLTAADTAREVLIFYVIANWIGVVLLVVGLHLTRRFTTRPRTLLFGVVGFAAAAATAHFSRSSFVQSALFPALPLALLLIALPSLRAAAAGKRNRTAGTDARS